MEDSTYLDKRFRKDDSVVFRNVGGDFILVPIRKSASDVDSIYTLNEVAARIWELIDGANTVAAIRDAVVQEYDVTAENAENDLIELLTQLQAINAVKEV